MGGEGEGRGEGKRGGERGEEREGGRGEDEVVIGVRGEGPLARKV